MRKRQYHWENWLGRVDRGEAVVLRYGEDYSVPQTTIAQQVRNEAARRSIPIKIEDSGLSLTITRRFPRADSASPISIQATITSG